MGARKINDFVAKDQTSIGLSRQISCQPMTSNVVLRFRLTATPRQDIAAGVELQRMWPPGSRVSWPGGPSSTQSERQRRPSIVMKFCKYPCEKSRSLPTTVSRPHGRCKGQHRGLAVGAVRGLFGFGMGLEHRSLLFGSVLCPVANGLCTPYFHASVPRRRCTSWKTCQKAIVGRCTVLMQFAFRTQ
jgi:hypothetical protein